MSRRLTRAQLRRLFIVEAGSWFDTPVSPSRRLAVADVSESSKSGNVSAVIDRVIGRTDIEDRLEELAAAIRERLDMRSSVEGRDLSILMAYLRRGLAAVVGQEE